MARRNPPPPGPPDEAIPPPELAIGPCIEVWAPPSDPTPREVAIGGVPPAAARVYAARRRWNDVAFEWRNSRNLTEPFQVLPSQAPWSVDGDSARWHFDRLGMTRAEVLALRPTALAYDVDAFPRRKYDPATGRWVIAQPPLMPPPPPLDASSGDSTPEPEPPAPEPERPKLPPPTPPRRAPDTDEAPKARAVFFGDRF